MLAPNHYMTCADVQGEIKKAISEIAQFMGTETKKTIDQINLISKAINELQQVSQEHSAAYQKLITVVDNLCLHEIFLLHHTQAFIADKPQPVFTDWCAARTAFYKAAAEANTESAT